MNWYNADIGNWNKGYVFSFQAANQHTAFNIANAEAMRHESEAIGVVQIRTGKDGGKAIFDYLNGFYDRSLP